MPSSVENSDNGDPVDAVVMWVDGSDPKFVASRAKHLQAAAPKGTPVHDGAGRHRDNGELRYMLRAIESNVPWIRRIYIVTNGQAPGFVDFSSSRIRLVTHREIFPDPNDLPNFNTFAIESCLHQIPGLAERFVRFSDDFFVCAPISREAILGSDSFGTVRLGSRILLRGRASRPYDRQLAINAERVFRAYGFYPRHNYLHTPQFRRRSHCRQLIEKWKDEYSATRSHRFRGEDDCITLFLYPYFVLAEYRSAKLDIQSGKIVHPDVHYPTSSSYRQVQLGSSNGDWQRALDEILQRPPTFLNLNDAFGENAEDSDLEMYASFMASMFPYAASFERPIRRDGGSVAGGTDVEIAAYRSGAE